MPACSNATNSIHPLDGEGARSFRVRRVGRDRAPHPDAAERRGRTSPRGGGMAPAAMPNEQPITPLLSMRQRAKFCPCMR